MCSTQPRVTLVNTSCLPKPTELPDVCLDVLAICAMPHPELESWAFKDLLDTIGADNCRK